MSTPTNEPTARERFHAEQARVIAARATRKPTDASVCSKTADSGPLEPESVSETGGCL